MRLKLPQTIGIILLWFQIVFGIHINTIQAQTDSPPAPTPIVPSIEIDSIIFNGALNVFSVNLVYINQGFIGSLNVKVENQRTSTLVIENNYSTTNTFNIDADLLVRGESYILTVTALDATGTVLRLPVPQSFGQDVLSTIVATRNFEYDITNPASIVFSRIEYDSELLQYNLTLDFTNTEDIVRYNLWLQGSNGFILTPEFTFIPPLTFPLSIPIEDVPAGEHVVTIEGIDVLGEVVVRTQSDELNYVPLRCNIICQIARSPIATIMIAVIVTVLLLLLGYSYFSGRSEEYVPPLSIGYRPGGKLINDEDMSIHMRESNIALRNAPRLSLILKAGIQPTPSIQNVLVNKNPFAIGSNSTNHLQLDEDRVSGRHAIIKLDKNRYQLIDNSTNGTKINSIKIQKGSAHLLKNGDIVQLANVTYRIEIL